MDQGKQQVLTLEVASDESSGERLDRFLSAQLPQFSRSQIKALIERGGVSVNGSVARAATRLSGGEIICADVASLGAKRELPRFEPKPLPLEILYEDDAVIVVNKAAGVVVHPGVGTGNLTTLVEGVWHYLLHGTTGAASLNDWPSDLAERPGVVHRLDRDTSGVMVMAKTVAAHHALAEQFREKSNLRVYLALTFGLMRAGERVIESYLTRDPQDRTRYISLSLNEYEVQSLRQRSLASQCRYAKSSFKPIATFGRHFTLCQVQLETGRTHQIRVHAKAIKHPIVGDPAYGPSMRGVVRAAGPAASVIGTIERQMLHAWKLGFRHPTSQKDIAFEAPAPPDFLAALAALEALGKVVPET